MKEIHGSKTVHLLCSLCPSVFHPPSHIRFSWIKFAVQAFCALILLLIKPLSQIIQQFYCHFFIGMSLIHAQDRLYFLSLPHKHRLKPFLYVYQLASAEQTDCSSGDQSPKCVSLPSYIHCLHTADSAGLVCAVLCEGSSSAVYQLSLFYWAEMTNDLPALSSHHRNSAFISALI